MSGFSHYSPDRSFSLSFSLARPQSCSTVCFTYRLNKTTNVHRSSLLFRCVFFSVDSMSGFALSRALDALLLSFPPAVAFLSCLPVWVQVGLSRRPLSFTSHMPFSVYGPFVCFNDLTIKSKRK